MTTTGQSLYEKCKHCHLFVEPNSAWSPAESWLAAFIHLHRGDEADEKLDESHGAQPSGMVATLATWKRYGPDEMRRRFVGRTVAENGIYLTCDEVIAHLLRYPGSMPVTAGLPDGMGDWANITGIGDPGEDEQPSIIFETEDTFDTRQW